MSKKSFRGWSLDRLGDPQAEVICPHGNEVDLINKYDYGKNRDEQEEQVSLEDLKDWVRHNSDVFWDNYCRYSCLGYISEARFEALVPPHWS